MKKPTATFIALLMLLLFAEIQNAQAQYCDCDGDGYGALPTGIFYQGCNPNCSSVTLGVDCNDANSNIYPGAFIVCDGYDDNCDQDIDGDVLRHWYKDQDGDGFGDPNNDTLACSQPSGYVDNDDDFCRPFDRKIYPGAPKSLCYCNPFQEGLYRTFYQDFDGDHFGNFLVDTFYCSGQVDPSPPSGWVIDHLDCNDQDAFINPDQLEICGNGKNDNCRNGVDEKTKVFVDDDGDGHGSPCISKLTCPPFHGYKTKGDDCDDGNPAIPVVAEACNGIDDNCNGEIDEGMMAAYYFDQDGDSYGNPNIFKYMCEDFPEPRYVKASNGKDCDDNDEHVHPPMNGGEECNQKDDNCNGQIDEGLYTETYYKDLDGDETGNPATGFLYCPGKTLLDGIKIVTNNYDCDDDDPLVYGGRIIPTKEDCNNKDDNCNGEIDEGLATEIFYYDRDNDNFGEPGIGYEACPGTTTIKTNDGVMKVVGDHTDCNDFITEIHPGKDEECNFIDDNCDGEIDEGERVAVYRDHDVDGFGNPNEAELTCYVAGFLNYTLNNEDCNDNNAEIKPGIADVCNNIDDNCNGEIDEDAIGIIRYFDADGDGFGGFNSVGVMCDWGADNIGWLSDNSDCDNSASNINPNVAEILDGIDQNCNGQIDEGLLTDPYYSDIDGDGYGDPGMPCSFPSGFCITDHSDCNDDPANGGEFIHPNQMEDCNKIDDNCNGMIDEGMVKQAYYADADGDGQGDPGKRAFLACPGYPPVIDNGVSLTDNGLDCNDADEYIFHNAAEQCNNVDDDCDGKIDEDLPQQVRYYDGDDDNYGSTLWFSCGWDDNSNIRYRTMGGDCDDGDPLIRPNRVPAEDCNNKDDNCNGEINENLPDLFRYWDWDFDGKGTLLADNCYFDEHIANWVLEGGDCDENNFFYEEEKCNNIDDNCNGVIDEGLTVNTYYSDNDGDTYGGTNPVPILTCLTNPPAGSSNKGGDCNDSPGSGAAIYPNAPDFCDGKDANCNGVIDDDGVFTKLYRDADGDGYGSSSYEYYMCSWDLGEYVEQGGDCNDDPAAGGAAIYPSWNPLLGMGEECNCKDDNCDGNVDEGLQCTQAPLSANYANKAGGPDPEMFNVAVDRYGNAYVIGDFILTAELGSASLTSQGANDIFIAKYNPAGTLLWTTSAGSTGNDHAANIAVNDSGTVVYITGICRNASVAFFSPSAATLNSTGTGSSDFFVAKMDAATGNFTAAQMSGATSAGTISDKVSSGIGISADGNIIYVSGGISACGSGNYGSSSIPDYTGCGSPLTAFLSKYDSNCNLLEVVMPQNTGALCSDAMMTDVYVQPSAAMNDAGKVFVSGFTPGETNIGGNAIGESGKLSPYYAAYPASFTSGNPAPARVNWIAGAGGRSKGITVNDDGFVYLIHTITDGDLNACENYLADSLEDAYLSKFDSSSTGGCLWNKRVSTKGTDEFTSITPGKDDTVYVGGYTTGSPVMLLAGFMNQGGHDGFIAKYDGGGNLHLIQSIAGEGEDYVYGMASNENGGIYVVGSLRNSTIDVGAVTLSAFNETHGYIINLGPYSPILITSVFNSAICRNKTLDINFIAPLSNTGNVYTAQLSNSTGNFDAPTEFGTLASSNTSGTIHATIPDNTPAGNGYRVRVISSNPVNSGKENGENIIITSDSAAYYHPDADNDGYGNAFVDSNSCEQPLGYLTDNTDCIDTNSAVHPGVTEICNRLDDNCDGVTNEGFTTFWYPDGDDDGFGDNTSADSFSCSTPLGYVSNNYDCNDAQISYEDWDDDGYAGAATGPCGYAIPEDCDDTLDFIHPGANERCNGLDDDCDALIDEDCDDDDDGFTPAQGDCDDTNEFINPGANERCNRLDDNCDGFADEGLSMDLWYQDFDQDGYGNSLVDSVECTQPQGYVDDNTDCDDTDDQVGRLATYFADADHDGFGDPLIYSVSCSQPTGYVSNGEDCDDSDPLAFPPGSDEVCNGVDDNCNGLTDEISENIIGIDPFSPNLNVYNLATYVHVSTIPLSLPGFTVQGGNAITKNPVNGLFYAILKVSSGPRRLVTVNISTGVCSLIGSLGDNFSSLTFSPIGKLFAVTGDGAAVPSTLYQINPVNASKTLLTALGNGSDGEVIAYNSTDGYIYHWSGGVFEKIHSTTYAVTDIALSGYGTSEVVGAVYKGNGNFIISNLGNELIKGTAAGSFMLLGTTTDYLRGVSLIPNIETCNGIDDDCDGQTDEGCDGDGDGYSAAQGDCNDNNISVHPGATELCNGIDDNCDGDTDENISCDDSDECTVDACAGISGCQNIPIFPTTITCPANVIESANVDACSASSISLGIPSVNFNCNVASISNNAPAIYSVGTTGIEWKAYFTNGDSLNCVQTVTILDNQNPTITCPADVVVITNAGQCTAAGVSLGTATASDNCVVSADNNAPATFPIGNTSLTWTATDASGNTATCVQTVTVNVNTEICNGLDDDCDGETDENISCADSDECTTDACAGISGCQNTPIFPTTITCPANVIALADAGACSKSTVTLGQPLLNSNCNVASISNNAPAIFPAGTTGIVWKAYLTNGDSLSCAQIITILDNQNPTITCPANVIVNANAGQCIATGVSLGTATASDNCAVSTDNNAPASFAIGNASITWKATDANGNIATCVQTVTVNVNTEICNGFDDDCDGQTDENISCDDSDECTTDVCEGVSGCQNTPVFPTTITCPANISVTADYGYCSASPISLSSPTFLNCNVASVTNDAPVLFTGTTEVRWTVTDLSSNILTCTQLVTIISNCDDGNVCTTDACSNGVCDHTQVNCNDNDACTSDGCSSLGLPNGCYHTPVDCNDNSICTVDNCNPATGCIYSSVCDDNNACTTERCYVNGFNSQIICFWNPICNDSNACTIDGCFNGICDFIPVDCNDNSLCTEDFCDTIVGCINNIIEDCYDGDLCTIDACIPETGACLHTPVSCQSNFVCTVASCDPTTGMCLYQPLDCNDGDPCTTDLCTNFGSTGCYHLQVNCDDYSACTIDFCSDGICMHTPIDCNDEDACTDDICTGGVCTNESINCDDNNSCTDDACNNGCINTPLPLTTYYRDTDNDGYGNPNVSVQSCSLQDGYVTNNQDCNDGNADINPGKQEVCDGLDNNCNGQIDEGVFSTAPTTITTNDADNKICSGTPITLTVSGGTLGTGASYKWYSGSCGATLVGTGNQITVSPTVSATYFVRAEGCNITACIFKSITLWPNPSVNISPTGTTTLCQGAPTVLTASGAGLTYQWYNGATLLSGETGQTFMVNSSTLPVNVNSQFRVLATSINGCSAFSPYKLVMVRPLPDANFTPIGNITLCSGVTQLLSATAGYTTYQWSRNGSPIGGNTSNLSAYQNGTYSLKITSSYSCTATSQTSAVITYSTDNLSANAGPDQNTLCANNATLAGNTPGAGVTGTWTLVSGSGTPANANLPTSTVTGLSAGLNKFTWKLSSGTCTGAADTVVLNVLQGSANPVYITAGGPTNFCFPGSVTLTAHVCGTGWTFQWQKNGVNIAGQTAQTLIVTSAALATYSVRAAKSAVQYSSNSISINTLPVVTINGPAAICPPNVTTTVSVPQFAGVTYEWYKNNVLIGGAVNSSFVVTSAGAYRCKIYYTLLCYQMTNAVTITALPNCSSKMEEGATTTVEQLEALEISIYPNPATEWFFIEITGQKEELALQLSIYDLAGKELFRQDKMDFISGQPLPVEVPNNISTGLYLVVLRNDEEKFVKRIVIGR